MINESTPRREVAPLRATLSAILLTAITLNSFAVAEAGKPTIGSVVGDLRFKDIRALDRSLAELGEHKATVLIFTTTTFPLVRRSLPKLIQLHKQYADRGVRFVAVNVGPDDTIREMAEQDLDSAAPFPFVKETDQSCVSALGARRTPEVAVLDQQWRLVYRGRIDDQLRMGGTRPQPTRKDLEEALNQLLVGEVIAVSETPVDGCEITHPAKPSPTATAVEYHRDISPLLDRKCNGCHRPGTAAPFALQTMMTWLRTQP